MSREDVRALLAGRLELYREYDYARLATLVGSCQVEELSGADGTPYQLEFEFLWDSGLPGDIRVIGGIDGGNISTLTPLTDSFIKARDGEFVGE